MQKTSLVASLCVLTAALAGLAGCRAPGPNVVQDRIGDLMLSSIAAPFYVGMSEADALRVDAKFEHADMLMTPADWSDAAYKATLPDGTVINIGFMKDRVISLIEVVESSRSIRGVHVGMSYADLLELYPDAVVEQDAFRYGTCYVFVDDAQVDFGHPYGFTDKDPYCEGLEKIADDVTAWCIRIE